MTDIATIPKNSKEEFRVSLDEFRGHQLLNVRVWYRAEDDEMRPGRQGIALRLALLPDLARALEKASNIASMGEPDLEETA
ncbi:transcriptional coactivator p15/PC4 family protein [uncultured Shimia sp.]|uniref:transcriptional coactivator p15/PC4 family protein n=1 Tax=uncultured Shimia sp. TaxID=573152 RepID=UPI002615D105|nr:transcriptional coactivator p15/PC4 family protein [uncultured Shimia sp.]